MASSDTQPSQSLINAAVQSFFSGSLIGAAAAVVGPGFGPVGLLNVVNIVQVYHSSLVPSVSVTGQSIPRQYLSGPLAVDKNCLAPQFDHDFTNIRDNGNTFRRGNQPYERPCGSYQFALKVKDKFGTNNDWLGMKGDEPAEWPVSYHGTAQHNALSIAEEGFILSKSKRFMYGNGIYSTPELEIAKRYASSFVHEGTSYKCVIQNRVNPEYLKVIPKAETKVGIYWLSAADEHVDESEFIRPYGLCLFKIHSITSLNFQHLKKSLFDEFCQIILSNQEIKQNIISLQLSGADICDQIDSFLPLFPLNEFIHLQSLSLIKISDHNINQVLPILPFLSDLYYFCCSSLESTTGKITPTLLKSKIRILTVPQFNFNSIPTFETMSLTSLTIYNSNLSELCQLFQYTPMLKYIKIERFNDSKISDDHLNFPNTKVIHLKQLIMRYCKAKFQALELLLKRTSNLKIFSICAHYETDLADADRWKHLIETTLPHLHVFKFVLGYIDRDSSDEKLIKLQKFQTDFWIKQHHWYTDYEIDTFLASVYTIPCIKYGYRLRSTTKRYINSLTSNSNVFDNVKDLLLDTKVIRNDLSYYFKNVQSLTLTKDLIHDDDDDDDETEEYDLSTTQIKILNTIVNISSIKHLNIAAGCHISASLLSKLLKKLPNVSSLQIKKRTLITFLKNRELCKCLNKKITKLDISTYYRHRHLRSNQIDLLCKTFSNLEQLHCYIKNVDDLLIILGKFSKLSRINLQTISTDIYSWIQINASTLNVYIDFTGIN